MKRLFALAVVLSGCATVPPPPAPPPAPVLPRAVEAVSLLGTQLVAPPLAAEVRKEREEQLAAARRDY